MILAPDTGKARTSFRASSGFRKELSKKRIENKVVGDKNEKDFNIKITMQETLGRLSLAVLLTGELPHGDFCDLHLFNALEEKSFIL